MWRLRSLVAKLKAFLRPRHAEAEMTREMAAHLAMLEDDLRRRGLDADAARRQAMRRFGGLERTHDLHREARSLPWLEQLRQDLVYAVRHLRASKTYTTVAVLTLALGIGANSAVFSVIHPLMIEPLPFDRPGQLVQLVENAPPTNWVGGGRRAYPLPPARADELRDQARSLSGLFQTFGFRTTLFEPGDATSAYVAGVSEDTFSTLRARPLLGRLLAQADHGDGAEPVAVVSHAAWQRYWRGEPGVLGSSAELDMPTGRRRYRIVGVLPEDFDLPVDDSSAAPVDIWTPGDFSGHGSGSALTTVLRVRDDTGVGAAGEEVAAVLAAMGIQTATFDVETGAVGFAPAGSAALVPLKARRIEDIRTALLVLTATAALVLLIACANVANLVLGRAATRVRELAIRRSLGATRWRLTRQLLTETLVLCVAGGAAGLLVAGGGVRLMSIWPGNAPPGTAAPFLRLPAVGDVELDGAVLAFTFAITLLTGLLFGLGPALALGRESGAAAVPGARPAGGTTSPRMRGRQTLIVAQVALSIPLLVAAGLLTQSFWRLMHVDPGFSTDSVMTFRVTASRSHFRQTPPFGGGVAYFEELTNALRELPGVEAAGYGPPPFLFGSGNGVEIRVPGGPPGAPVVNLFPVGGDYLGTLGIPVLQGRGFDAGDDANRPLAVVVNEAFVREHLGERDPIGLLVGTSLGRPADDAEIVGVVGDVHSAGLDSEPYPQVLVDYRQAAAHGSVDYWWTFFAVRTSRPNAVIENAASVVRRYDPEARIENVAPLEAVVADSVQAPRFFSGLFGAFACLGVALAVVGLFGVVAYSVAQRTREIGIRMALGAGRRPVLMMVLGHGAALCATGIVLGLAAAFGVSRYLSSLLFGIEPLDLPTFVAVAVAFFAVSMLAAWLPARAAARVDPVTALRHD